MSARRNIGRDLTFLTAYTWSHSLADASNTADFETLSSTLNQGVPIYHRFQGNAGFDVRHRLSVASVYELPIGRGRKLGTNWNRFTDTTLGGWNLNQVFTVQSGFPWNVWTPSNLFADRTCNGNLPKSQRTIARWFDYTCFPTHIDPIKGQPSPGNAGANVLYGPGLNNWDMGIHKVINFTESKSLEIRLEGFNIWNHPQLNGPAAVNWFNNTKEGAEIVTAKDQRQFQLALRFAF